MAASRKAKNKAYDLILGVQNLAEADLVNCPAHGIGTVVFSL